MTDALLFVVVVGTVGIAGAGITDIAVIVGWMRRLW